MDTTTFKPVLDWLEFLSKYGLIDIVFGIGILQIFRLAFRRTKVDKLPGIDILRGFDATGGYFEIEVSNLSSEPLYIYRSYFTPWRFEVSTAQNSYGKLMRLLFQPSKFPPISRSQRQVVNTSYSLKPYVSSGTAKNSAFIEPQSSISYRVPIEDGVNVIATQHQELDQMINSGRCGTIELHCVHGQTPRILIVGV
jgi:hypothetical protein